MVFNEFSMIVHGFTCGLKEHGVIAGEVKLIMTL